MIRGQHQAIQLHESDNVICLLRDLDAGEQPAVDKVNSPALLQDTLLGHKIAVIKIDRGEPVVKYGVVIGVATQDIKPGEHVHLHNLDGLHQIETEAI